MIYCEACSVRQRAICAGLSNADLAAFNAIGHHRHLEPGESLMWEGEDSAVVANVIDGVLKVFSSTADGREQIVGVAFPSDFLGRPLGNGARHGVTALTTAHVCVFPRTEFDRFISENPTMERNLLKRTLAELDRSRDWMLLLARKTAGERVASFLLEMAERMGGSVSPKGCPFSAQDYQGVSAIAAAISRDPAGEDPMGQDQMGQDQMGGDMAQSGGTGRRDAGRASPIAFEIPFSRQQVADILGLTIETVSRQLTRLKRLGIIDLPSRRKIIIKQPARLVQIAEGEI